MSVFVSAYSVLFFRLYFFSIMFNSQCPCGPPGVQWRHLMKMNSITVLALFQLSGGPLLNLTLHSEHRSPIWLKEKQAFSWPYNHRHNCWRLDQWNRHENIKHSLTADLAATVHISHQSALEIQVIDVRWMVDKITLRWWFFWDGQYSLIFEAFITQFCSIFFYQRKRQYCTFHIVTVLTSASLPRVSHGDRKKFF
jgi:hypothetical protein